MASEPQATKNTDKEIWRGKSHAEFGDDDRYYADSLFIPAGEVEALGINCGGTVIVKPIREWHALAAAAPGTSAEREALEYISHLGEKMALPRDISGAFFWKELKVARECAIAALTASSEPAGEVPVCPCLRCRNLFHARTWASKEGTEAAAR